MKQTGPFYLGIDIGTGNVKVMLIDENRFTGRIISDFSSAVSSLLVDANRLNWDIRLVERAGLRLEML